MTAKEESRPQSMVETRTEYADGSVIEISIIRRGLSKSGRWHDGPEGCTLAVEECKCSN